MTIISDPGKYISDLQAENARLRAVLAGLEGKIGNMPRDGGTITLCEDDVNCHECDAFKAARHGAVRLICAALAELDAPTLSDGLPETIRANGQCDGCMHNHLGNLQDPCSDCGAGEDSKYESPKIDTLVFSPVPSEARAEAKVEDGEQWDGGML